MSLAHSVMPEFREAPAALRRQSELIARPLAELVRHLRRMAPNLVMTCSRGSSANAAAFGKHLIERHLGIPVAAAAPNIATIYRKRLRLDGELFLAISQSGQSDDLIESARMAKAAGALVSAIVNDLDSPLAAASDIVLPIAAGHETGIAATKTFVATLSALLRLVAAWTADEMLATAITRLPERLSSASELDWRAGLPLLSDAVSVVAIGRGPTLAIAREAALKLKEGCNLHAEAFSGAEFRHGPIALVSPGYPVLIFLPTDAAAAGLWDLSDVLRRKGAAVLRTGGKDDGPIVVPVLSPDHADADCVCLIQTFYGFLAELAAARGIDLAKPRHLQKITRTT
jgi:glucosamine--fructose-6-phosphate aminotransferase (isomerizing)